MLKLITAALALVLCATCGIGQSPVNLYWTSPCYRVLGPNCLPDSTDYLLADACSLMTLVVQVPPDTTWVALHTWTNFAPDSSYHVIYYPEATGLHRFQVNTLLSSPRTPEFDHCYGNIFEYIVVSGMPAEPVTDLRSE